MMIEKKEELKTQLDTNPTYYEALNTKGEDFVYF